MIDGNPHDFIDTAYSGQDIVFSFRRKKYWFQGYTCDDGTCHMEIMPYKPASGISLWECDSSTMENCLEHLQDDLIFDGKSFWEVEREIQWLDD